jgi:serine protease Do
MRQIPVWPGFRFFSLLLAAGCSLLWAQTSPQAKSPDALRALSSSLQSLSRRVSRSVVQVFSTGYMLSDEEESTNASLLSKQHSSGSGIILSADGYIVTNAHVVQGARRVQVQLPALREQQTRAGSLVKPSSRTVDAKIVGIDRETDIAVLKIGRTGLPHLSLGDSQELRQGQLVLAFGNPLGLEDSVSMGIISSVARQLKPDDPMVYIQTDASINPGNSGGRWWMWMDGLSASTPSS